VLVCLPASLRPPRYMVYEEGGWKSHALPGHELRLASELRLLERAQPTRAVVVASAGHSRGLPEGFRVPLAPKTRAFSVWLPNRSLMSYSACQIKPVCPDGFFHRKEIGPAC
jgi:hypothetical protein